MFCFLDKSYSAGFTFQIFCGSLILVLMVPLHSAWGDQTAGGTEVDYCTITCDGRKHTMCRYQEGGPRECAMYSRGLTPTMRKQLLDIHNDRREQTAMGKGEDGQPKAANMVLVEWSDEAEKIAQRWADQCTQGERNDECRSLSTGEPGGQNVAHNTTKNAYDLYIFQKKIVVDRWYNEGKEKFNKDNLESYKPNPESDKYTQIVWALTYKIGCGFSYIDSANSSTGGVWRLVCNYYPGGNIPGQSVYLKGDPCTKCPNARCSQQDWPALCAHPPPIIYNRNTSKAHRCLGGSHIIFILVPLALHIK